MTVETNNSERNDLSYSFRPAAEQDYPIIYEMQNIPFRSRVFANTLPVLERFIQDTVEGVAANRIKYYILEKAGSPQGFAQYVFVDEGVADVVVWGKWVNTLMYVSIKTAFEELGLNAVRSNVRIDNKRVMKTYQRLGIRTTGRELMPVRIGGPFSGISMVGFQNYEMTREEFAVKADELRRQSLNIQTTGE